MTLNYDDDLGTAVDRVNLELAPFGLRLVDDGLPHDGYMIYRVECSTDLRRLAHDLDVWARLRTGGPVLGTEVAPDYDVPATVVALLRRLAGPRPCD